MRRKFINQELINYEKRGGGEIITERNMLGIPIRESCVTCIHAYSVYEYDNGCLLPESRHYICKITDKEYYEPDTPTDCLWYHVTEYYKWKK